MIKAIASCCSNGSKTKVASRPSSAPFGASTDLSTTVIAIEAQMYVAAAAKELWVRFFIVEMRLWLPTR